MHHLNADGKKDRDYWGGGLALYLAIAEGRRGVDDLELLCVRCNRKYHHGRTIQDLFDELRKKFFTLLANTESSYSTTMNLEGEEISMWNRFLISNMDTKWIEDYENRRHSKQLKEPKENSFWLSTKYDFSNPDVRLEYVPEMGCSVGGCISALKRSWKAYKIAGRNGEPRGDIAWRIRNLQLTMGIKTTDFEMLVPEESEENEALTKEERQLKAEEGDFGTSISEQEEGEWSEQDKQLRKEELQDEDSWWFSD